MLGRAHTWVLSSCWGGLPRWPPCYGPCGGLGGAARDGPSTLQVTGEDFFVGPPCIGPCGGLGGADNAGPAWAWGIGPTPGGAELRLVEVVHVQRALEPGPSTDWRAGRVAEGPHFGEAGRVGTATVGSGRLTLLLQATVVAEGGGLVQGGVEMSRGVAEPYAAPCSGGTSPPRKSARLAGRGCTRMLEGLLREGPSGGAAAALDGGGARSDSSDLVGCSTLSPGHRKIRRKGAKCGVLLSDDEVRAFRAFLEASP